MTKRAIIYGRVSGDDRDSDGRNLKSQLDMGREFAAKRGYILVDALTEDIKGASGAEIDLPQLNNIRKLAAADAFDVLVVREIDRLSRNLAKQLIVEEELKHAGVEIEYVLGEYPDTPEGNFMKHVRASVAEFEREKIAERTKRARRNKAKAGHWVGHCMAFGYRKIGQLKESQLAIDDAEAEVVRRIFQWYTVDNLSLCEIAHRLTVAKVTPPGADYNKPTDHWGYFAIRRILANRSYIGEFTYAGTVIPLPDMALVDMATLQRAQERLLLNPKRSTKRRPGRYLLADHVYCVCKKHMTCYGQHSGYDYYACHGTLNIRGGRHGCGERLLPKRIIESMIWQWLTKIMANPDDLKAGLEQMATNREDEVAPTRARIADIDRLSKKADRTIAGLISAFDPDKDDPDVVGTLRAQVDAQKQLKAGLKVERAKLEADLDRRALPPEQVADILEFAAKVNQRMGQASWKGKDKLIDALNVRVDVLYEQGIRKVRMSCDLPGVEETSEIIVRANHSSNKNVASP